MVTMTKSANFLENAAEIEATFFDLLNVLVLIWNMEEYNFIVC